MKTPYLFLAFVALIVPSDAFGQGIRITEIDLINNIVEITNDGGGDVDISNWWLCNRVNGSPFYAQVSTDTSVNAASFEFDGGSDFDTLSNGDVLVLDVTAGFLPDSNGEFAFYNTNSFGSASAIEDYVAYGSAGIRDSVAQNAGIWTDGDFIDLNGLDVGETIQLAAGEDGNSSQDYFFGPPTFGSVSIPEPSSVTILGVVIAGLGLRRNRS